MAALDKMPRDFKDKGIWFGDAGRALKLHGWEGPLSADDLVRLDRQRLSEYGRAQAGIVADVGIRPGRGLQEFRSLFGFDPSLTKMTVKTGVALTDPFAVVYSEIGLDEQAVRDSLLRLGYSQRSVAGRHHYSIRGDREVDPLHPAGRIVINKMNRVYVSEGVLVRSTATDEIEAVLRTLAGDSPSLADDKAIAALAGALGDPLSATFMSYGMALEQERGSPQPKYVRQPGWGSLHRWDWLAAGFGISEGRRWWRFAIFYEDGDAAAKDGDELVARMKSYRTVMSVPMWPERPFEQFCDDISSRSFKERSGSVLVAKCELKDGQSACGWHALIDFRDLGFLLP